MNFQQIVLSVSGVFLIVFIIIAIYGVSSSKNKSATTYVSNCPDYWEDITNDGRECISRHGYNKSSVVPNCSRDFSGSICDKYNKVLLCPGIVWNGITYGNSQNTKDCTTP